MHVIGHRGAAGLCPENTLPSFERAIALGADAVECDVHLTADGQLVCMHDPKVDRTTGGSGRIADLDLSSIRALDAGGGARVPTLAELLDLAAGRAHVAVELKAEGTEAPAVAAVRARGLMADVTFISFELERLRRVSALAPEARTGALFSRGDATTPTVAAGCGAAVLDLHFAALSAEVLAAARALGQTVWVWTPNAEADLRHLIDLGPDGITTDWPDRLLGLLGR